MANPTSSFTDGAASAPFSDVERERLTKKLEWRCRRGMKELDILLTRYVREQLPCADVAELNAFTEFLELPDPEIAEYLLAGVEPKNPHHAELRLRILAQP